MLLLAGKIATATGSAGLIYGVTAPPGAESISIYNLTLLAVLLGGVVVYVIAQVKDYKPNKRLREDNSALRHDLDDLQRRFDELQKALKASLEENETLKRSRDFDQAIGDLRADVLDAIANLRKETSV